MKIKAITLFTDQHSMQREFFSEVFGFVILENSSSSFSVQVGATKMTFEESDEPYIYHYCFLIPANKLNESIDWLQRRLDVIEFENGRVIEPFTDWNAHSVYFYDAVGNISEFIVRHDLENESDAEGFDVTQILCVNEIGVAANSIEQLNKTLEAEIGSSLWKGNLTRFGANGTQEGLFLLVNYNTKEFWFPTQLVPKPSPFRGTFESKRIDHDLEYRNEEIRILHT